MSDEADAFAARTPSELRKENGSVALRVTARSTYMREGALRVLFQACATAAIAAIFLIFVFVGIRGWPIFAKVGLLDFLGGRVWDSSTGHFGILPFIFGSFAATLGALALGTPLAVGTAVFLSEIASPRMRSIVRPAVELLAGIPSVVYGFFGIVVLLPLIQRATGELGFGLLAIWLVLAIMIVPTIAAISEDALCSVHPGIREASYAMGATRWQTIYKVLLPAARIGIIDAIILGMGRAIGETMAVLMVAGNAPVVPKGIFEPIATLTSKIVLDMSYASGDHRSALFGMAVILFVVSMSFVAAVRLVSRFGGDER